MRRKYNNQPQVVDNIRFASKREAKRYAELKMLQQAGKIGGLECHPSWKLIVNNHSCGRYEADFSYWNLRNGEVLGPLNVEDSKGFRTPVYKLKKLLVKAIYGIEIQEV